MVERDLAKVEVAGSTPVSRSSFRSKVPRLWKSLRRWTIPKDGANLGTTARYPSGKGEVCKTFIRRFDSDPRLQSLPLAHALARTTSSLSCGARAARTVSVTARWLILEPCTSTSVTAAIAE